MAGAASSDSIAAGPTHVPLAPPPAVAVTSPAMPKEMSDILQQAGALRTPLRARRNQANVEGDEAADEDGDLRVGTASDHLHLCARHAGRAFTLLVHQICCCCLGERASTATSTHDRADGPVPASGGGGHAGDDEDEEDLFGVDAEELLRLEARRACLILPIDPWKEMWDVGVLTLIIYSAVMVPYRICFDAGAVGEMWYFEQAVTAIFITDVVFNFNTAVPSDPSHNGTEQWELNRGAITCRYMQGWFWIDVPSCVPVELLDLMLDGEQKQMGLLRFLRLFRLVRLLRLLKVDQYVAQLEDRFELNLTFLRIVKMIVMMLFLSHMLACFWFYTHLLVYDAADAADPDAPPPLTWVSAYDDGSALHEPPHVQYLYSMYWALTTLTTVGYGDITPANNAERMYAAFALLMGALVFGYLLSSIGSLFSALDRQAALSEEKMDAIKEYMRWRRLPRSLTVRMRRYYENYYEKKTAFDEAEILHGLTPPLRFEVIQHSLQETIGRIPLFRDRLDPLFQMELYPLLQPVSVAPREIIYSRGDPSHGVFFLLRGRVEAISQVEIEGHRVLYIVRQGQSFGESVLTGRNRRSTERAATACDLFTLSAENLQKLFISRPREGRLLHQALLREHLRKVKLSNIALRLVISKLMDGESILSPGGTAQATSRQDLWWFKFCESLVFRAMPLRDEANDLTLTISEVIDQRSIAPPGTTRSAPVTPAGALKLQKFSADKQSDAIRQQELQDTYDSMAHPTNEGFVGDQGGSFRTGGPTSTRGFDPTSIPSPVSPTPWQVMKTARPTMETQVFTIVRMMEVFHAEQKQMRRQIDALVQGAARSGEGVSTPRASTPRASTPRAPMGTPVPPTPEPELRRGPSSVGQLAKTFDHASGGGT